MTACEGHFVDLAGLKILTGSKTTQPSPPGDKMPAGTSIERRRLPQALLDDLRWQYPKPYSATYTFPDEPRAPSIPHFHHIVRMNPNSDDGDTSIDIVIEGFELGGASVVDYRWSCGSRRLRDVLQLRNSAASRRLLRQKISKLSAFSGIPMPMGRSTPFRTLIDIFVAGNMQYTTLNAQRLVHLMGSNAGDVVCNVTTMGEMNAPFVLCSTLAHNDKPAHPPRRGQVVAHLNNDLVVFQDHGDPKKRLRLHRCQLDPTASGDFAFARCLTEAFSTKISGATRNLSRCIALEMFHLHQARNDAGDDDGSEERAIALDEPWIFL